MPEPIDVNKNLNKKTKILVTSALPYVNNVPHLGTLVCILSADVFTRFQRLMGNDVLSVLGTDEHGTTTETIALKMNMTPKEAVDHFYKIHKEVYDWFNCEFDCFGRTSSPENVEITQDIFLKLMEHGYITPKEVEQMYDEKAQKYLSDRFIGGICPYCKFEDARGDQCENCGKLLNPNELINPVSKLTGTTPTVKTTEHLFIKLHQFQAKLQEFIDQRSETWSENAKTTTYAWLKEGLKERAITRDLKWGIPVPIKGYENKVFYVWFDAPIGYIAITKANRKDWKEWWHNPRSVRLIQFMGKDNIPFHSILFPASLIGTWDNYTLIDTLNANEYLNYESSKFSKSRGVGVFGDNAKDTGIPADVWRYYIMVNRPEKMDTTFTWKDFQEKINADLVGNLGNLINRTLTFIKKFTDYKVKEINEPYPLEYKSDLAEIFSAYQNIELKLATKKILALAKKGNQYFQEKEPWKAIKEHPISATSALCVLVNLIKDLSVVLWPIMPKVAENIQKQLNIDYGFKKEVLDITIQNHKIGEPETLFSKLEDKEIQELKEKYSGSQQKDNNTKGNKEKRPEVKNGQETKEDFLSKIDLRVAKIISVKKHPQADKLYVEKLNCGNGEERTIVSGLVPHYSEEELIGKNVIIVYNLKPANIRGVLSQGMLLAAGTKDQVGILHCPKAMPGDKIYFEETNREPIPELEIEEFFSIELKSENKNIFGNGKKMIGSSEILVDKGIDGKIK